jgi:hypothetical protein
MCLLVVVNDKLIQPLILSNTKTFMDRKEKRVFWSILHGKHTVSAADITRASKGIVKATVRAKCEE